MTFSGGKKKRSGWHDRFRIPSKYALLLVTLLCILLMVITFNTKSLFGPLNIVGDYLVVPFQNGVSSVGKTIIKRREMIRKIEKLEEKNTHLEEENARLIEEKTRLQQQEYELARLQELYKLDKEYPDYEKIGARIIAKDTGNWYHSFIIDKGSEDGLLIDMNVMAAGGLVGRISSQGKHWARVSTIIDDDANVSGTVLSTSDNLMVSGDLTLYDKGVISFSQLIDENNKAAEGDKIVTSNISDKYLPGILVGYISYIESDANNITRSGNLTPAVDFKHLDTVLVILKQKENEKTD